MDRRDIRAQQDIFSPLGRTVVWRVAAEDGVRTRLDKSFLFDIQVASILLLCGHHHRVLKTALADRAVQD